MSAETAGSEKLPFPIDAGAAVVAHCLYEDRPIDPDDPNEVLYAARTVMNHTGMEPHEVADYIPEIKATITEVNRLHSND